MANSIDLSIGRMQQRQPIDPQVYTAGDLQPARVDAFKDPVIATAHQRQPIDRPVNTPDNLQLARFNIFRDRLPARFH
jgi:hypothetical protein